MADLSNIPACCVPDFEAMNPWGMCQSCTTCGAELLHLRPDDDRRHDLFACGHASRTFYAVLGEEAPVDGWDNALMAQIAGDIWAFDVYGEDDP